MSQELVQIKTETGELTPFFSTVTNEQKLDFNKLLEKGKAGELNLDDVTPEYWDAKSGEEKWLVFKGWKVTYKEDESTKEMKPRPLALFWDGKREIVMGQKVVVDKMMDTELFTGFKITCTKSEKKQAKLFKFEQIIL